MFRSFNSVFRLALGKRCYCNITQLSPTSDQVKSVKEKPDFKLLKHPSKVLAEPFLSYVPELKSTNAGSITDIDTKTIQLLERLALVDLDSEEALTTINSSIKFADRIVHIDTEGVAPLYTVLEEESLKLRADCVTEGNCREEALRNAKVTDEDYFVSPPGNIPLEQAGERSFARDLKKSY